MAPATMGGRFHFAEPVPLDETCKNQLSRAISEGITAGNAKIKNIKMVQVFSPQEITNEKTEAAELVRSGDKVLFIQVSITERRVPGIVEAGSCFLTTFMSLLFRQYERVELSSQVPNYNASADLKYHGSQSDKWIHSKTGDLYDWKSDYGLPDFLKSALLEANKNHLEF